jgi:hypothetical protein
MQQQNSDGESGFPWAFAFDPAANVRALGNVQRRGLHAASQAVDTLLSTMDAGRSGPGRTGDDPEGSDSDIGRLAALWTELVTRGLSEMVRLGRSDGQHGGESFNSDSGPRVWVDLGSGQSAGSVEVAVDASGSTSMPGEVWLHNHTSDPLGPVRFHCGELRSPNGVTVPSEDVRFDPPEVAEIPGRSSRGIDVSVSGDSPRASGIYRGIIQAMGAPAVAVKIELTVRET